MYCCIDLLGVMLPLSLNASIPIEMYSGQLIFMRHSALPTLIHMQSDPVARHSPVYCLG